MLMYMAISYESSLALTLRYIFITLLYLSGLVVDVNGLPQAQPSPSPQRSVYIYQYVEQFEWSSFLNRFYTNEDDAQISQLRTCLVFMPLVGDVVEPAIMIEPLTDPALNNLIIGFKATQSTGGLSPDTKSWFTDSGWHVSVTQLGSVELSNQQLFDPGSGDGFLTRVFSSIHWIDGRFSDYNHVMMRMVDALGPRSASTSSWQSDSIANKIYEAFQNYQLANEAKLPASLGVASPLFRFLDSENPLHNAQFGGDYFGRGVVIPFAHDPIPDLKTILPTDSSDLEDISTLLEFKDGITEGAFGSPIPDSVAIPFGSPQNPPFPRVLQPLEIPTQLLTQTDLTDPQAQSLESIMVDLTCPEEGIGAENFNKRSRLGDRSQCNPTEEKQAKLLEKPPTSIQTRTGGVLRSVVSIGGRVLAVGSLAALAAMPAFIIMDFVEGQWKAAAWATSGVAAAIGTDVALSSILAGTTVAGFSVAGPVGLFVGAVVGLLFAIIPGLFKKTHSPTSNNVTQIIQFAFFGDARHTGNEQCNDNLAQNNQTQNCSVSYGAGALASMFAWDIYDASVFLIEMNQGYAMTIPDIAENFTVYDYTNPVASANASAFIDCGKSTCHHSTCSVADGYSCAHPKFNLRRNLITLPIINQTADVVFDSVNSGECKIVSDPIEGEMMYTPSGSGNNTYGGPGLSLALNSTIKNATSWKNTTPLNSSVMAGLNISSVGPFLYTGNHTFISVSLPTNGSSNMTASISSNLSSYTIPPMSGQWRNIPELPTNITGKPVSILCNLTANIPDVLSSNYNLTQSSLYTSANTSTDGDTSGFVAPPRPHLFTPLNTSNAVCLYYSKEPKLQLCLPDGTFTSCHSGIFDLKTSSFDTLTAPVPANLTLNLELVENSNGDNITPWTDYTANATAADGLGSSMSTLTSQKQSLTISTPQISAPLAPAMCLYSAPHFQGDVFCLGIGGSNFSSNLVNKTASLTLSQGIVAWLYPGYYGNPLGAYVSTDVADLSGIPYKTDSTFQDVVAAAWIYNASAAVAM